MARDKTWYQELGSEQDPFSANPATGSFFFETPALTSHLNTLTGVANKGEFIGLVKGDRGIGKTTLLNQLALRYKDDPTVSFTRVTCTEGGSLIQALGISSGLSEEDLAHEPRKVLIEHLTRLRHEGQTVVAGIDDAHLLSPQDLAMLIRIGLSPNANGLVHTILFAESDIEARLWLSAINDPLPLDRLYTLILTPFSADQTQAYLGHRLRVAGLESVNLSNAEAMAIHRKAEGLPATVNELATQRLQRRFGSVWSRGAGALDRLASPWAAAAAVVALLAGLAVWQQERLAAWSEALMAQVSGPEQAVEQPLDLPPSQEDEAPLDTATAVVDTDDGATLAGVESTDTDTAEAVLNEDQPSADADNIDGSETVADVEVPTTIATVEDAVLGADDPASGADTTAADIATVAATADATSDDVATDITQGGDDAAPVVAAEIEDMSVDTATEPSVVADDSTTLAGTGAESGPVTVADGSDSDSTSIPPALQVVSPFAMVTPSNPSQEPSWDGRPAAVNGTGQQRGPDTPAMPDNPPLDTTSLVPPSPQLTEVALVDGRVESVTAPTPETTRYDLNSLSTPITPSTRITGRNNGSAALLETVDEVTSTSFPPRPQPKPSISPPDDEPLAIAAANESSGDIVAMDSPEELPGESTTDGQETAPATATINIDEQQATTPQIPATVAADMVADVDEDQTTASQTSATVAADIDEPQTTTPQAPATVAADIVADIDEEQTTTPQVPATVATDIVADIDEEQTTASQTPSSGQVPRPRQKPTPPPAPVQVATAAPSAAEPSASSPNTRAAAASPASSAENVPLGEVRRESWFRQQSPGQYVIQLVGSSREQALRNFISSNRFPRTPGYYRSTRQDEDWYVLVLGTYSSQRDAQRALNDLPGSLRRNGPWVRSMASVQAELE